MTQTIAINFAKPLPAFPLGECVLLPHNAQPLHIFEDRYRTMTRDALDSSGLIAMAMFDGPVSEQQYLTGKPPLRSHVCVGYCIEHERLDDGRYLLMLQGLCRARIRHEVEHDPYRLFMLRPTEPSLPPETRMRPYRRDIMRLLDDEAIGRLDGMDAVRQLCDTKAPTAVILDVMAGRFYQDAEDRYRMLCEPDAEVRARRIIQWLGDLRDRLNDYGDAAELN